LKEKTIRATKRETTIDRLFMIPPEIWCEQYLLAVPACPARCSAFLDGVTSLPRLPAGGSDTPENKKAGRRISVRYFGNPAVSVRPCRLSAPSSRMVEYYRLSADKSMSLIDAFLQESCPAGQRENDYCSLIGP
jgi:hypothetical protein